MRAVDFWVMIMVEVYVVEFVAESYQSFSKVEAMFSSELRGELLREVPTWIKMFLAEEGLLSLPTAGMEV